MCSSCLLLNIDILKVSLHFTPSMLKFQQKDGVMKLIQESLLKIVLK